MDRTQIIRPEELDYPREIVLEEHGQRIRWREMTLTEVNDWRENSYRWPPVKIHDGSWWVFVRIEK